MATGDGHQCDLGGSQGVSYRSHGATKQRQGLGEPHGFEGLVRCRTRINLIKLWISIVPLVLHSSAATEVPMKGQNECVAYIKLAGKWTSGPPKLKKLGLPPR